MKRFLILSCIAVLAGKALQAQQDRLFSRLPSSQTGITFSNNLVENAAHNIITYEYFYNGGGAAAGDFNNDGLIDLYFTSNQQPNKLYLNKGNFKFQDITKSSGVAGRSGWKTGVSVADVNGDGYLDIYVCYSGDVEPGKRANQLFVNNGDLTFTDKAKEWGIADEGYSTHAAFFDFDRDGDLDLYVLNHNIRNLRNFDAAFVKKMVDPDAGDRLYENSNGKFIDISRKAGIISNPLGYGLGISIADINNDGWPDIYVSNDYVEEDYLYLNDHNGHFSESLKSSVGHLSNFSMGLDIADVNNDGLADIFTLDMLPRDNRRQKLLFAPDNYELYNNTVSNGFYHQLMRNMFQLNNGDGTFSEIGQLAGISNTDWSWAALFADYNNDGQKDLFVTNGYGRDMINRDFVKFYANERLKHLQGKTDARMFQMLQGIKSTPLHNYIFENTGNLQFRDQSERWGFQEADFSHGAVYADLDNDGDLDLAVNRMNDEAAIYKNTTSDSGRGGQFFKLQLSAGSYNKYAIGAKVSLYAASGVYTIENYPVHGFQSSMQIPLHFGFPDKKIDSLIIRWPDGLYQVVTGNLQVNQQLLVQESGRPDTGGQPGKNVLPVFTTSGNKIAYTPKEELVNDFKVQPLMLNMISYAGPRIAKADINGDMLEDIYICGSRNQPGVLFLQQASGDFIQSVQAAFDADAVSEDAGAVFFDADKDGDADLYVVSGGYALDAKDPALQDRLYINEAGTFIRKKNALPAESVSGAQVVPLDFDQDGDTDLFIAGRIIPGRYPESPGSSLLVNNGRAVFTDQTATLAPVFSTLGMVTDAVWADINKDDANELIVCGEWMAIRCFHYEKGIFRDITGQVFEKPLNGLWNRLQLADIDKDGDLDLFAGNWGCNSQLQVADSTPMTLYYGDFDNNGFIDPVICYFIEGKSYPMASRDEITDQLISLRQRFPTYDSYADATIREILTPDQLNQAKTVTVDYLHSTWFENTGKVFRTRRLPVEADFSPVYAIQADDFNHDGNMDILLGGNTDQVRVKIGKMDASYGQLFTGDGKGNFQYVTQPASGLSVKGCIRDIVRLNLKNGKKMLLFGINSQVPVLLTY